jgi:hypothetical protein
MAEVYRAKAMESMELSESARLEADKYKRLYEQLKESLSEVQNDEEQHEEDDDEVQERDHHDDD